MSRCACRRYCACERGPSLGRVWRVSAGVSLGIFFCVLDVVVVVMLLAWFLR